MKHRPAKATTQSYVKLKKDPRSPTSPPFAVLQSTICRTYVRSWVHSAELVRVLRVDATAWDKAVREHLSSS